MCYSPQLYLAEGLERFFRRPTTGFFLFAHRKLTRHNLAQVKENGKNQNASLMLQDAIESFVLVL